MQKITRRFWAFLILFANTAGAQISPGPLARAHQQLEGLTKCLSCHEVGQKTSNAKCLQCHTAIAERLQAKRGYHAGITTPNSSGVENTAKLCAACHSEHHGVEFALIRWEKGETNFDHRQTGYILAGKHAQAACRDCHQQKNIQENFTSAANVRLAKTFLGLSQKCSTCHADEHRGQLGTTCERCHDFTGWKPAAKFTHDRAPFVLTGKHKNVACAKCHPEKPAREKMGNAPVAAFVQYTGMPFANCTPCHQDPHRGSFGNACTKCHATEGWKTIRGSAFNHDLTAFPLRGRHRNVACEKCHAGGDFKRKVTHQFCRDCHVDAHAGQFARRLDKGRCESCHNVEGFVPTQFTLAAHQKLSFVLLGAHQAVPCGNCHTRQTAGPFAGKLLFVFPKQGCAACHADAHAGQFADRVQKGGCEICHQNESWHQTKFDHNTARFKLAGAHQKVACSQCHPRESTAPAPLPVRAAVNPMKTTKAAAEFIRYRPLASHCHDCHQDVHRGQFGKKEQVRCEKCHQSTLWSELLFVHNRDSAFKLDGAHEKIPCEKCHFPLQLKDQTHVTVYKPLKSECAACHR